MKQIFIFSLIFLTTGSIIAQDSPTTREMNFINWMEFAEFVPEKIETVLLPVGTLEPHGVIPNGADNIAPERMAKELAAQLNAMIAPTLNYGVTGSMKAYPGAFAISKEAYQAFIGDIIVGLSDNHFKNIIIMNGHGGPQTAILQTVADELSHKLKVRILIINWWSVVSEDTFAVFGENGGHSGNNETAYIQAFVPEYIHKERYTGKEMTTPYPSGSTWSAYPFPSSIGLYEEGQGFPTFDDDQANEYFSRVNNRIQNLIEDVITKWDLAKLYRD